MNIWAGGGIHAVGGVDFKKINVYVTDPADAELTTLLPEMTGRTEGYGLGIKIIQSDEGVLK